MSLSFVHRRPFVSRMQLCECDANPRRSVYPHESFDRSLSILVFFFFFLHMRILKENGIDTRIFNLRKIDFFPCSLNRDFLSIIDFWSSFISFLKKIESERKNLMIVIKLRYITISVQRFENSISTINLYHFSTNLLYALIIEILKKISWKFSKIISRQYMSDVK